MTWTLFDIDPQNISPYSDFRTATRFDVPLDPDELWRAVRITGPANVLEDTVKAFQNSAVSSHIIDADAAKDDFSSFVVHAPATAFDKVDGSDYANFLSALRNTSVFDLEVSPPTTHPIALTDAPERPLNVDKGDVLMAVIDDTIGFANSAFRADPLSTRIKAFWNMDVGDETNAVLDENDINGMLRQYWQNGAVNESALYAAYVRDNGLGPTLFDDRTHGTHVLDLMAGYPMTDPTRLKRPIIAVQLPRQAVLDSSGTEGIAFVAEAISWIKSRANSAGRDVPLVINFSFGLFAGPHDGTSPYEKLIESVADRPHSIAVVPSGNSFRSQTHARFDLSTHATFSLNWHLPVDNGQAAFVEMWLPQQTRQADELSGLNLTITPPYHDPLSEADLVAGQANGIRYGQGAQWRLDDALTLRTYHQFVPSDSRMPDIGRERVMIAILPTYCPENGRPTAPAGPWQIDIQPTGTFDAEGLLEIWIQRGGNVFGGNNLGQQSYFDDPNYAVADNFGNLIDTDDGNSPILREGTLNALGTARRTVCVGGYTRERSTLGQDRPPASFASAGSEAFPCDHPKPLLATLVERGRNTPGILAAGTLSGTTVPLGGTSVAAPQVARAIGDYFAQSTHPSLGTTVEHLKCLVAEQDKNRPKGSLDNLDGERLGLGRLNAGEVDLRNDDPAATAFVEEAEKKAI